MYELKVKNNHGEVFNLSTSDSYTVYQINGLNPPKASVSMSTNATSDGSKINSVKLPKRNIVIYTTINREIETNRIKLYSIFPIKREVTIYFTNDSRDVFINGVVESIECDFFKKKQIAQISILCANPYFNDVDYLVSSFSDVSSLFEFPFIIDEAGIPISEITTNVRKSIINRGDVDTGVIIELFAVGTVVNPVVYKAYENSHMAFNYTMRAGDKVVINTNVGNKSIELIRDGVATNFIGYMTPDSDWLRLDTGDNVFTYSARSGGANLQITFTNSILYGGV